MPDAFPIFFHRRNPFSGQSMVMPEIVKGKNVLFAAPTASGKTEAAIAPLYQRHVSFTRKFLSTIYIAPTKALANDLYDRLMGYLGTQSLGLVARYTGDHHEFSTQEGVFCLIVTPEALDSLQLRHPNKLKTVRSIIVDEIHLLHGQARGQQLRHVIDRIKCTIEPLKSPKDNFQILGMTATLDNPQEVSKLWLGENSHFIIDGTPREIDLQLIDVPVNELDDPITSYARKFSEFILESSYEKVLVFTNSRNNAHKMAAHLFNHLEKSKWPIYLHTGSVAKPEREYVEESMKKNRFGICVATATLEIGIDIGDIDLIALVDRPFSVNSFLQRIGRGNRRTNICRVIGFKIDEECEKHYNALLDCSKHGEFDDIHEYDRPSVRFQQILSLAWRATRNDKILTVKGLAKEAGTENHLPVISDMIQIGCLKKERGALIPSDRLMDECDSASMHSVIVGSPKNQVIDQKTGKIAIEGTTQTNKPSTVYHSGNLRELLTGPKGDQFLRENTRNLQNLAIFNATSRPPAKSRGLIWSLVRQEKIDPYCWLIYGNVLYSWGGQELNLLLRAIFSETYNNSNIKSDEYSVSNVFDFDLLTIDEVYSYAKQVEKSHSFPLEIAKKFTKKSRYFKEMSESLQEIEYRASIPWDNFYNWLEKIKKIKRTQTNPFRF